MIVLASRQPDPDIYLMDIIWITQFVESGWLEPLDSCFSDEGLTPAPFFSRVVAALDRHDGQTYALTAFLDVGVLCYRKDLLDRYGFDGTTMAMERLGKPARPRWGAGTRACRKPPTPRGTPGS